MATCVAEPIFNIILASLLCAGGIISYIPQIYSLVKSKQTKGISEMSLFILCLSYAFLTGNAVILNWTRFECYGHCSFWICTGKLLSLLQITIGWIMVFPLYIIFLRYKIKNSDSRIISDLKYILIYIITIGLIVIVGVSEKIHEGDNPIFFLAMAKILGILSGICSSIVWLPQIIKLLKTKESGNLSLPMFIMQSPGNAIIIVLQILYHQDWTTWLAYVITLVEQTTIVIILIVYKCRDRDKIIYDIIDNNSINDIIGNDIIYDNGNHINDSYIEVIDYEEEWIQDIDELVI
jgi:uncharacterized protein with PQ loop repeat